MKQQFRRAAFRPEYALAGDDAVVDEEAIEILFYRHGQRFVLFGLVRAPGEPKDRGVTTKPLIEKRDCPADGHPLAQGRIDGLKRVVPVPVSITQQMRAGNEALPYDLDQLGNMDRNGGKSRGNYGGLGGRALTISARAGMSLQPGTARRAPR